MTAPISLRPLLNKHRGLDSTLPTLVRPRGLGVQIQMTSLAELHISRLI